MNGIQDGHGGPCRMDKNERRRRSVASSSENSTKSRGRAHGTQPSSRRTSCTLDHPSTHTRHYRIQSWQIPSPTTVDDVLALHFRSCSLLQHRPGQQDYYASPPKDMSTSPPPQPQTLPDNSILPLAPPFSPTSSDNSHSPLATNDTTTHWLSHSTRRKQYAKIDRANSRVRGLVRRIIPRCVSGPPPPRFYDQDASDTGSVRRYRLSLADEEEEQLDEKRSTALWAWGKGGVDRSDAAVPAWPKKRWSCF